MFPGYSAIKKSAGYVLFVTMIYLQLIALLAMESLKELMVEQRQTKLQLQYFTQHQLGQKILEKLDSEASCVISQRFSSAALLQQPANWWRLHACHGTLEGMDYYYFTEPLAVNRCAMVRVNENVYAPSFVRHTVMLAAKENFYQSVLLQDTIAEVSSLPPLCNEAVKLVTPGRQMLRILR